MTSILVIAALSCEATLAMEQAPIARDWLPVESEAARKPVAMSATRMFDQYSGSVATVIAGDQQGTAFVLSSRLMVTCAHVVSGQRAIRAVFSGGIALTLEVLRVDEIADIAVLLTPRKLSARPLPTSGLYNPYMGAALKDWEAGIGSKLYVISSPLGLETTIADGLYSQERFIDRTPENPYPKIMYIQTSVPVSPGSSGSPLMNRFGQVIGVISRRIEKGNQLNFAVCISEVGVLIGPLKR